MKKSLEAQELVEEIKDMFEDVINPIDTVIELSDDQDIAKSYDGCGCDTCKEQNLSCSDCPKCQEDMSKTYESDNEEEDKWDNVEKACWTGYKQQGMKDKNGRMVPNCVPVEKANDVENEEEVKKSLWDGKLDPISFAKRKFTTAQRKEEAKAGHAMPDGSYPISNKKDLENAIRSWGRGGAREDVKAHIKRRAKALGAEDMIPDNWK